MQTEQNNSEAVLNHHLEAFANSDIDELMKDYTDESEIWTPQGAMVGLKAITSFYTYVFSLLPKEGTRLELKQKITKNDKFYIVWNADSPVISVPFGADCFEIKDDKIVWQTTAAHIIHK